MATNSLGLDAPLTSAELAAVQSLNKNNKHHLEALQKESYQIKNTSSILLSTSRKLYYNYIGLIVLTKAIKTSKGTNPLEDRIVYQSFDTKGTPTELSKKDGTK